MMTAAATDFLVLKAAENELFQQVQILKRQYIVQGCWYLRMSATMALLCIGECIRITVV
jgi:hypothetical protein